MAKRFTDTNKYKKPFIRGLQGAYKVLWDYLYHDCDHAGIWIVDFEVAQIYVGQDLKINKKDALKFFNENEERIIEFDCGKKWFIPSFIDFQYGELNPDNRAHKSVITILENKGLTRSLQGRKDMDMDKDKDKDKKKGKIDFPSFKEFLEYAKTIKIYNDGFDFQIEAKYNAWKAAGWKDGNNKKIINWKTKLQNTMVYFKKTFKEEGFPDYLNLGLWRKLDNQKLTEYKKHLRKLGWTYTTNPNGSFWTSPHNKITWL